MSGERPKLKPPVVKTGREWSTRTVPRLYLDDIEDIYGVLLDYVPHSSQYQLERARHKAGTKCTSCY